MSFSIGLQYDWGKQTGRAKIGQVNANTIGIMSSISWADFTLTAAYNKNFGNTGALPSIGGGPFFTSLEEHTLDFVEGDNTRSGLASLEYSLYDDLTFGVAAGKFTASDKKNYNKEEINLYINYSWKEILTFEVMYAAIDDRNSEPDMHQIRTILTYRY
jgi:hypothetical protein